MIISSIVAAIIILCVGFGIKMYMDDQAHKAFMKQYNEYLDKISKIKDDMLSSGAKAESANNDLLAIWYNSIWKKSDEKTDPYTKKNGEFVSDFNEALTAYHADINVIKTIVAIENSQILIDNAMGEMINPPKGLEEHYDTVDELYDVYTEFLDLSLNPTGSYKTFNAKVSDLDSDFMVKYKKVEHLDLTVME